MQLYLLKARPDLDDSVSAKHFGYDRHDGFVIRAESEEQARDMAQSKALAMSQGRRSTTDTWTDPGITVCEKLSEQGASEILLEDFYEA